MSLPYAKTIASPSSPPNNRPLTLARPSSSKKPKFPNMSYLILFVTGLLIGVAAGLLIYRKHSDRLKSTEDKGKSILDALKGR